MTPQLILASRSPRRRALLRLLEMPHETAAADVDETPLPGERPRDYVLRLARAKAAAVAAERDAGLVLGADTTVVFRGEIVGKPADAAEAVAGLRRLRGERHEVITALALQDAATGRAAAVAEQTGVWIRALSDEEIAAYVATGDPLDKAGGYAIQHEGFRPVARIQGSETNVIGLPVAALRGLLGRVAFGS